MKQVGVLVGFAISMVRSQKGFASLKVDETGNLYILTLLAEVQCW